MSIRIALAGNPNSGKTTLFNQLTGSTAHVGNWPGVTVERKEGKYKKTKEDISIIDLPGIYSLSPYSPEEVVARNYIVHENPDVVVNIVDSTNLERNLYLTTQILETDVPVIIALNMMDIIEKNKDTIDIKGLETRLGVPVVPISASKNRGSAELMAVALKMVPRKGVTVLNGTKLEPFIDSIKCILDENGIKNSLYYTIKIIENDKEVMDELNLSDDDWEKISQCQSKALSSCDDDCEAVIADLRYKFITKYTSPLVKKTEREGGLTPSDKIDKILTHRIWGIPIFAAIMFLIFHLTFSENLFFTGIRGPGVFFAESAEWLVEQGVNLVNTGLVSAGASEWARSLVVDGVLAGVGAVIGFIPLILVLYFFISILEDSGYMARAAFVMDKVLRKFGLSGKSFVPMIMGFGCSVPAVAATKTIENEKDRRLTIMLIPFMSCGAKIPIYALIVPIFFPHNSDLVITAFYLGGVLIAILAGIILKKTVFKGEVSPFIMELPPYRLPNPKSLALHLYDKFKGFATKVGTIITVSTIIIWFLANFGFDGGFGMVEANSAQSILGYIGNAIKFFFVPLGFASGTDGWKTVVAVITGLVAKEAVISTMGQLYTGVTVDAVEDKAAATLLSGAIAATFSAPAALAFITWNLLSTPCMAAVGAIHAEMNSRKYFWGTMAFHLGVAWVMSFLVFRISSLFF